MLESIDGADFFSFIHTDEGNGAHFVSIILYPNTQTQLLKREFFQFYHKLFIFTNLVFSFVSLKLKGLDAKIIYIYNL